jgi:hypothetical protein
MSKSFVLINLNERNSLLNTILTICICGLTVLIFYLLYRLVRHIYPKKCINVLPLDMTSDDKQLWINGRIFNEIRHISRPDNACKLSRIRRKRKSKMYNLFLTQDVFSNILS